MKRTLLLVLCLLPPHVPAASATWSSSSKDFGESRSDFTMREVERRARSSLVQLDIKNIGGSVGSSMIIACMMARLAEEHGGYRYLVKDDSRPGNPGQMLVGFSHKPHEKPQSIDPELPATAMEVDLDKAFGGSIPKLYESHLGNEIEARHAARLDEATDVVEKAIAGRLGSGAVDGKIQVHVAAVRR